jgi:hypothetical protein
MPPLLTIEGRTLNFIDWMLPAPQARRQSMAAFMDDDVGEIQINAERIRKHAPAGKGEIGDRKKEGNQYGKVHHTSILLSINASVLNQEDNMQIVFFCENDRELS